MENGPTMMDIIGYQLEHAICGYPDGDLLKTHSHFAREHHDDRLEYGRMMQNGR